MSIVHFYFSVWKSRTCPLPQWSTLSELLFRRFIFPTIDNGIKSPCWHCFSQICLRGRDLWQWVHLSDRLSMTYADLVASLWGQVCFLGRARFYLCFMCPSSGVEVRGCHRLWSIHDECRRPHDVCTRVVGFACAVTRSGSTWPATPGLPATPDDTRHGRNRNSSWSAPIRLVGFSRGLCTRGLLLSRLKCQ